MLACPVGYEYPAERSPIEVRLETYPEGLRWRSSTTPGLAVRGRFDVVYTDVWTSMGQEAEFESRTGRSSSPTGSTPPCCRLARPRGSIFLHCLPARRGEEVTDEVLDGPRSRVIPQAANRLHFQKALLAWLLPG